MQENNIPKRKKAIEVSLLKKTRSEETFNKSTKRKPGKKSLTSTLATAASRSTLLRSTSPGSNSKPSKESKKKKTKIAIPSKPQTKGEKEPRKLRETSIKTAKKVSKKKKEIEQKQEELTERKKVHQEYFMYKDTYLPIENTEQRKVVYKIKLIDENQTRQNSDRSKRMISAAVETIKKEMIDVATSDRKNLKEDIEIQTEFEETRPSTEEKCEEKEQTPIKLSQFQLDDSEGEEKCFAETLSELEFLYLPDEKNFEGFSKIEKAHYKELLMCIAKKFEEPDSTPLDEQTIEMMLYEREMKQRGIVESYPKQGIPTHTPSVISYLSNLFCFIEIHEKSLIIERVNCSYGYSLTEKLQRLRSGQSTKRFTNLIPESTFWKFEVDLHEGLDFESEIVESCLHAHNKAIFDAVNEVLIEFQPYYGSQGEPFPWSENLETTFYCITEDSFGALVGQVKDRIWDYSNTLAGVILETEGDFKYKNHIQKILANEKNLINGENKKYTDKVEKDEARTEVLLRVSEFIETEIIKEMASFLSQLSN